jgi:hypothetical protein
MPKEQWVPDTFFMERGQQWPRKYTSAEVELIVNLARPHVKDFGREAFEKMLQQAAEEYQRATLADGGGIFFMSNKEIRYRLNRIIKFCDAGRPTPKIELALRALNGPISQRLGPVNAHDPQRLADAARSVLAKIPRSGPLRRARRQFIGALADIFKYATGKNPTRRVHDQEYGPFREFVIADSPRSKHHRAARRISKSSFDNAPGQAKKRCCRLA